MNNGNGVDRGIDLGRLFADMPEPTRGEIFARRVSRRIAFHRYTYRLIMLLLTGLSVALLAALTPWLMRHASHIALGLLSASGVLAVVISRVGWVLGILVVVFVFVKVR